MQTKTSNIIFANLLTKAVDKMHILCKVYKILIDEESNSKYKSLTKSENVLSDSEEDLDHKDNYVNIKTDKNLRSSKEVSTIPHYLLLLTLFERLKSI